MARVYVIGAHLPSGGTYMAYHVGRILAERTGLELVAVQVRRESAETSSFSYATSIRSVPIEDLPDAATESDWVICNPSFSDRLIGAWFPGRSLMYVQGVNTYRVIDGFMDHYVAVSNFVRDHLALHYGWEVPVIPPFVHLERIGRPVPWSERPPGSVLAFPKAFGDQLLDRFCERLAARHPDIAVEITTIDRMPHRSLLEAMQRHRHFLALSPLEGYGLTPIEAMASGCCVVGFHGGGGADYLRNGINADVVGYPRVDQAVDALARLVRTPDRAAALASVGRVDASRYDLATFEQRWSDHLGLVLGG